MFLLPVVLLAVSGAIKGLFAGGAYFVFAEFGLRCGAESTFFEGVSLAFLSCPGLLLSLLEVLIPALRGIMQPTIDTFELLTLDSLLRELLGGEFVHKVVFLLLGEVVKAYFKVTFDYINAEESLLSLVYFAFFQLTGAVVVEGPETDFPEEGLQVLLEGLHEVRVVEVDYFLNKVLEEDTHHPDLLILHKTYGSQIETILAHSSGEGVLHVVDIGLVQVDHFLLVVFVYKGGGLLLVEEDGGELFEVLHE